MKPAPFEYCRAKFTSEALSLLHDFDGYATALAGGQTLVPLLNLRLVQPGRVVDISRIESLTVCREADHSVVLGAGCSHAALEDARFPDSSNGLLSRVAGGIAHRSIRNRGTLGGSLAYADPAAEWPVVMTALGAIVQIEGPSGPRTVPMDAFITGPMTTVLALDELLVEVRVPMLPAGARWGFRKLSRKPGDFAQALAAVVVSDQARVVMGATPTGPLLLPRVAEYVSSLKQAKPDRHGEFEAAFAEDLSGAGIQLDAYEEQIHRHTLWRAITDVFDP